ncbi:MAG: Rap1a/Tai family immunity protein [Rhodospirillales bacterium]
MAQQNPLSGAALINACKLPDNQSTQDLYKQGVCAGIVSASFYHKAGSSFCPPQDVTLAQVRRIVIQYVDRLPRDQHLDLSELADRSLSEAWPCPAQPQRR